VRFDDRLLTVLNLPPGDRHDGAVRWRQLVDLVARAGANSGSPIVAAALRTIKAEAASVDEPLRAAAARAVAALPLPFGLLEYFAGDTLTVAAPVLAAATLDADQWRALAELADEECRRFIGTLHPDLGGESADFTDSLVEPAPAPAALVEVDREPEAAPEAAPTKVAEAPQPPRSPLASAGPSLSEVVARIERRRRSRRATDSDPAAATSASSAASPALFRWECGPSGDIAWVEGAPRGPLIGRSIARTGTGNDDGVDREAARAFAMRAPFRDCVLRLSGDGTLAGEWKISGVPAFEPGDGRFAGYRGIALRDVPPAVRPAAPSEFLADPDSLRELVHEIKTPLNAIMGFAEIIDGQFLGPADHRYRKRAVDIVGQAQLLVAAIDDLDFAAKVHSAQAGRPARVDLTELIEHGAEPLKAIVAAHGAQLDIGHGRTCVAAVEPELADRLVARLCNAVAERAAAGETLRLTLDRAGDQCRVAVSRRSPPRGASEPPLFGTNGASAQGGDDGADGFALRLIRGLARIAGGELIISSAGLALAFPHG
jgi:signal transduction histidine kinase